MFTSKYWQGYDATTGHGDIVFGRFSLFCLLLFFPAFSYLGSFSELLTGFMGIAGGGINTGKPIGLPLTSFLAYGLNKSA